MAKAQYPTKPRKFPSQERSRATVDAIMQASTYILNKSGWSGLNTNAIAERAGINISSLYQYFPNKQAIIAEMQRRHASSIHGDMQDVLIEIGEKTTLKEVVKLIVETVIAEHKIAPEVHRIISEELPLSQRSTPENNTELLGKVLKALKPFMINVPNPELATLIAGICLHTIVHQVTNKKPSLLDQPELAEEIVTLIERYLIRE